MDKKTSAKIASVVLFVHGFIEMLAAMMPFTPTEFPRQVSKKNWFFGQCLALFMAYLG